MNGRKLTDGLGEKFTLTPLIRQPVNAELLNTY